MRVSNILNTKNARLAAISLDSSNRQAAEMIANERVGMLLIVDAGGELAGMLSERDIVRYVAAQGRDSLEARVNWIDRRPEDP